MGPWGAINQSSHHFITIIVLRTFNVYTWCLMPSLAAQLLELAIEARARLQIEVALSLFTGAASCTVLAPVGDGAKRVKAVPPDPLHAI